MRPIGCLRLFLRGAFLGALVRLKTLVSSLFMISMTFWMRHEGKGVGRKCVGRKCVVHSDLVVHS